MRPLPRLVVVAALLASAGVVRASPGPQAPSQDPVRREPRWHPVPKLDPPKVWVVALDSDAGQAVLWDTTTRQYVVVRVGNYIHHYVVVGVYPDQVMLRSRTDPAHVFYVLPCAASSVERGGPCGPVAVPPVVVPPVNASSELVDPYAGAALEGAALLDPYGAAAPVLDPYGPAATSPRQEPEPSAAGAPALPPRSGRERVLPRMTVSRREFDAAVMDFHRLGKELRIQLVTDGVRIESVARGSVFHRWGLRPGDVVFDVDGRTIRGADDAAALYARLMNAQRFTVRVRRGDDIIVLQYRFAK